MADLPDEFVELLRDPGVYVSAEQGALRTVRAWVLDSSVLIANQSKEQDPQLSLDRYTWESHSSPTSSAETTPSAA